MITVRRSDTGTYVLVHEPSQVVVVGEDLQATYESLQEHLLDDPGPAGPGPSAPHQPGAPASRRAWMVGIAVLALLPFLWLSVLHVSLGRLIDELRTTSHRTEASPTKEVEALQTELHELEQTVTRLQTELGEARAGEAPERRRIGRARRPADASLAEGEPDDAAEDEPTEDDDATEEDEAVEDDDADTPDEETP